MTLKHGPYRFQIQRPPRHRERGAALVVAMLMLVLLSGIGLASLDTVMRDRQVAGYGTRARMALYAADAGIAAGLDLVRTSTIGAALAPGDCLSNQVPNTTLPNGARYRPDPTAPSANVCMLASAEPCAEIDGSIEQGQPVYLYTVWDIRVQGDTTDAAVARVEATVARCHAFNN